MTRIIDCINDRDSYWQHNGKTVFVFEEDLSGYEMCIEAIEKGLRDEN